VRSMQHRCGMNDEHTFTSRLDAAIDGTADVVARYFDPLGPFAGSTFDLLGHNPPTAFSTDDLLAVTLLDVRIPPASVRRLLRNREIGGYLAEIPVEVPLWEADDATVRAADALWRYLRETADLPGIGWVITGKLLARKRPHLVPIFDSVVRDALAPGSDGYWADLRVALSDEERRARIDALRPPALDPRISTLRVLDAAVWMKFSGSRNARVAGEPSTKD
jgi:hypothetical protein